MSLFSYKIVILKLNNITFGNVHIIIRVDDHVIQRRLENGRLEAF